MSEPNFNGGGAPRHLPVLRETMPGPGLRATLDETSAFFNSKRVLVTGAFGFVGGHLARALHSAGAHVTALDCDVSADRPALLNLTGLRDKVEVVEADITSLDDMKRVIGAGHFNVVFHLAAGATTIEKAMSDPYATILANTMGFVNLAEAVRLMPDQKAPVIIYSSTDKVYGDSNDMPYMEDSTRLGGIGVYDVAKLAADIFAGSYHRALGVPTIVLRMCNLYGPYDFNFDYRLVPKALRNIFRDGIAPDLYFNSLDHHRDYLYVDDAVRAFLLLAVHQGCRGRVYNLPGALHAATPDVLHEIVEMVSKLQEEAIRNAPDSTLARMKWDNSIRVVKSDPKLLTISNQHLDGSRIRQEAEFEPHTIFRDGLLDTVQFYGAYFEQCPKAAAPLAAGAHKGTPAPNGIAVPDGMGATDPKPIAAPAGAGS